LKFKYGSALITNDLLYQLSLCDVPYIGHVHAKILCEQFGSAVEIFKAPQSVLERIEGIGTIRARNIKRFKDFQKGEKEIFFIEKYGITPLFITDRGYPKRLLNCYDPPALLFYKGNADINASRIVSIVGTRNNSEYGKMATEKLVKALTACNVLIISGLAYGIDSVAHRNALKNGAPTIGVVGHGLDIIYPPENTALAREMLKNGGLLTEFRSNTKPDKYNFPSRNRIVAGISDATVVIESGTKGGSMITAEIACGYSRDVFALPGRIIDSRSSGCNHLISSNKAMLLQEPSQLIEAMGWNDQRAPVSQKQKELFIGLTDHEKKIVDLLRNKESVPMEELYLNMGLSGSTLAAALLNLEMKNVARSLPGKHYRLQDQS
jgi:DNA processing protein